MGAELVAWVQPQIPGMLSALANLITNALGWLGQQLPKIIEQLVQWGKAFIEWIQPMIAPMLTELGKFLGQILGWLVGHLPDIMSKLLEWGVAFISWIATSVIPQLPGTLAGILSGILAFIGAALPEILTGIGGWVTGMITKATDLVTQLPATMKSAFDAGISAIGTFIGDAASAMSALPGKMLAAIGDLAGQLFNAGRNAIAGLVNGLASLDIKMPHFNISWSNTAFGPINIPTPNFSVEWYAKGGIFNAAQMIGVGEAGAEAVLPLAKIKPLFAEAMADFMPSKNENNTNVTNNTPSYILNVNKSVSDTSIIHDFDMMKALAN